MFGHQWERAEAMIVKAAFVPGHKHDVNVQGYLFSRPVEPHAAQRLLDTKSDPASRGA